MRHVPLLALLFLSTSRAGEKDIYDRAVDLISEKYLYIEDFDPSDALAEAAEAAEDAVPWLIVDVSDQEIQLRHGVQGSFASLPAHVASLDALPAALLQLEDTILAEGGLLPADLDLAVELLRGASRSLDRHSVVLARDRLERFDERISGKLTGIGSRIGYEDGELVVSGVFPDSPAEHGGMLKGDIVLAVDGFSTTGMDVSSVVKRIRGPEDTEVLILVRRTLPSGEAVEIELRLTRTEVVIPNVEWAMRDSGVGVITIDHFSEQTARLLQDALREFSQQELQGIIVDLRGNSGGSMIQACRTADLFLEEGAILRTAGRDGEKVENLMRVYRAHPENVEPPVPVAVLMDRKSASASEIVAGALLLLDRTVLIGTQSHGKGTVQKLFNLRSGDADERVRFKLTVAQYLLPGDVPIAPGEGLLPDLRVRKAAFTRGGAWLPRPDPTDAEGLARQPEITYVDERQGWREGVALEDRDTFPVELAERILLASAGYHRQDLLDAVTRVRAEVALEEDALLRETFAFRGFDWTPAEEPADAPEVEVDVQVIEPPVAGSEVEVRALVRNLGEAPLYRAAVRLEGRNAGLPWSRVTLPIGHLPPGEQGMGSTMVEIDSDSPDRIDLVDVSFHTDARPMLKLDPVELSIVARTPPPLSASARMVPHEDHHRVELTLENGGPETLTNLHLRLALPEDTTLELIDREVSMAVLAPLKPERVDLCVHLTAASPDEIPVEVRADAEIFGRVLSLPMSVPKGGRVVRIQPPTVEAEVPLRLGPGTHSITVRAKDEAKVRSLTAWMHGQKIAWIEGDSKRLVLEVAVEAREGTLPLTVEAVDDQGTPTLRTWYILGDVPSDGTARVDEE